MVTAKKGKKFKRGVKKEGSKHAKAKEGKPKTAKQHEEQIVQKTNIIAIKKSGMNSVFKSLCRDLAEVFSPYSVTLYINKLKNLTELKKKLKELCYKYTISIHISNKKLMYNITSNYTKLTLTFIIQSFTNASVVRSNKIPKFASHNFSKFRPLLILKNFNNSANPEMLNYLIIIQNILKNMFPNINLRADDEHKPKRVILYSYNSADETIYFRQYVTNLRQKSVKEIINEAYRNDSLGEYNNMYNFLSNQIDLNSAKKEEENEMVEVGPRVSFKIFKIADQDKVIYSMINQK
ncbi:hypothetical protein PCYB_052200 [Plasmodium cynomolgi strain B]|uniref:Brix domain-containing protein n=1 Tax=Plasmodium cynomolgi (strain B) TaxID=1120755 RepID=K6V7U8_PLACD|nr:hypothetical protein PCYB_052200 [Plasmodium cynomolgi strain B]GAB65202.1 hypothetical protein PCYB_052200 [Plasmodium cynomolgi strain B]